MIKKKFAVVRERIEAGATTSALQELAELEVIVDTMYDMKPCVADVIAAFVDEWHDPSETGG